MDARQIAQTATREEAFALIDALREAHGLVGTVFGIEDVNDAIATHLTEHDPKVLEAFQAHIASEVIADYGWRKMGDQLAEHGNGILDYAVTMTSPFNGLAPIDPERTFAIVLGADDTEGVRTSVIEIGPFATPDEAVAKALALIGQTGEQILAAEPTAEPLSNSLLDGTTRGYSLAIIENGETLVELPATLPQG